MTIKDYIFNEEKNISKMQKIQSSSKRKFWSLKEELITKSRESMLSAVQIFNNPSIQFKSETFIVLSNIAWMYLLHAYYKEQTIDFRYFKITGVTKRYDKTKNGAFKHWELERCLNDANCPIDTITKANLKFLIGLRHEIEHQMTTKIDEYLSARFQACCLNFNDYLKKLFGSTYGIDKHLSFSLQFSTIKDEHAAQLRKFSDLPQNISAFINNFDRNIGDEEFNDIRYSYRVLYVPKIVNHKGQADKVIEFIKADSPEAEKLNKEYVVIKDSEKQKYLPTDIWKIMQKKGFTKFGAHQHTLLWKEKNAKTPNLGFGTQIANVWYWYDKWLDEVHAYCNEKSNLLK